MRNHRTFTPNAAVLDGVIRARLGTFQLPPADSPPLSQPDARRDAPFSVASINVCMESNPIAFAALAAAEYSLEQTFFDPSVHSLVTSAT